MLRVRTVTIQPKTLVVPLTISGHRQSLRGAQRLTMTRDLTVNHNFADRLPSGLRTQELRYIIIII